MKLWLKTQRNIHTVTPDVQAEPKSQRADPLEEHQLYHHNSIIFLEQNIYNQHLSVQTRIYNIAQNRQVLRVDNEESSTYFLYVEDYI